LLTFKSVCQFSLKTAGYSNDVNEYFECVAKVTTIMRIMPATL
jgi:hypothetical protein